MKFNLLVLTLGLLASVNSLPTHETATSATPTAFPSLDANGDSTFFPIVAARSSSIAPSGHILRKRKVWWKKAMDWPHHASSETWCHITCVLHTNSAETKKKDKDMNGCFKRCEKP